MLFNSVEFIFLFLPTTMLVYFALTHNNQLKLSKVWLIIASLFFYGWWNPSYLTLILLSMFVNFLIAQGIHKKDRTRERKLWLIVGILFNIALLGYFKYADFFIDNFNFVFDTSFNLLNIILPLGISFFTFQQIAFLVDTHKRIVEKVDVVDYCLFVSFFPQLIAGPIVHHKEVMPQLSDPSRAWLNLDNIAKGLFVFNMGLAKKIIIADTFGEIANAGYANVNLLDGFESWITAFCYSVQLYFDFSGYSDMAIGIALLFNINLPINFWSPHKAENIQQFYRRWHITLSSFLRDYVYIPLGGNKKSEWVTNLNLFLTFLIGGFWHGANWTFVIWGALNGIALVIHRFYKKAGLGMPTLVAIGVTFLFVMFVRVFFRAENFGIASTMLANMFGNAAPKDAYILIKSFYNAPFWLAGVILLFMPNTNEIGDRFRLDYRFAMMLVGMLFLNFTFINSTIKQDFLYFDF